MIVPDVNLLVFTYHRQSPYHEAARHWWEGLVNGTETIGMPWAVSMGFMRLMANPRVLVDPMSPSEALGRIESWFQFGHVQPLDPGAEHLIHMQNILDATRGGANVVPDAHIAALAIEHQAVLHSHDLDFGQFPGLQWHDPL